MEKINKIFFPFDNLSVFYIDLILHSNCVTMAMVAIEMVFDCFNCRYGQHSKDKFFV